MVSEMIKAVEVPDEFDEKPRILLLACENDAYPALDMAGDQPAPVSSALCSRGAGALPRFGDQCMWISTAIGERAIDGVHADGLQVWRRLSVPLRQGFSGLAQERHEQKSAKP